MWLGAGCTRTCGTNVASERSVRKYSRAHCGTAKRLRAGQFGEDIGTGEGFIGGELEDSRQFSGEASRTRCGATSRWHVHFPARAQPRRRWILQTSAREV